MRALPARLEIERVEAQAKGFWRDRGLPPARGPLGRPNGGNLLLLAAALNPLEGRLSALQRAVRADVSARRAMQAGARVSAPLAQRGDAEGVASLNEAMGCAGVWLNGGRAEVAGEGVAPDRLELLVHRLAELGCIVTRDAPMRSCPSCRTPRTPQTIVYEERDGPAYLVRFPLDGDLASASLLVWTDAAWKLLGAPAIAVNPQESYARVRFRRRGPPEEILVARSALPRIAEWSDGATMEVLDERPGAALAGRRFVHPLAMEFPALAVLPEPAGSIVASEAVEDRGTGAVAVVPYHGASDHAVAQPLGISGWPVVGVDGMLSRDVAHKYVGLSLDAAESFVLRDLEDSGQLFQQVRVRRGVPCCALCGSDLIWFPGRAWCLELGRLPTESQALLRRLLPEGRPLPATDVVAWPLSEGEPRAEDTQAPELNECPQCGRARPPPGPPTCECGGSTRRVRRRLLPAVMEALAPWCQLDPVPAELAVRFLVPSRNASATLVHGLVGLAAAAVRPSEVRLVALPTLSSDLVREEALGDGADPLRATLVRLAESPEGGALGFAARRLEEERRLRKLWQLAFETLDLATKEANLLAGSPANPNDVSDEDRAILARLERTRREAVAAYEREDVSGAHARLWGFLERDLRGGYLALIRYRLGAEAGSASRASALRTLLKVLADWTTLYAPIAPHTMEVLHQALGSERESVFDRDAPAAPDSVLNEPLEKALDGWRDAAAALKRYRHEVGLAADAPIATVVLAANDEATAADLRAGSATMARLLGAQQLEVSSPDHPWEGRRVLARPILEEIQRAYPAQARRIVRILEGMNGRRVQEGLAARNLEVALEGQPVQILPNMIELGESLPPDVLAVPWSQGELLVRLPEEPAGAGRTPMPALSPDGFRFLRTVQRRLATSAQPSNIDRLVVAAHGSLAEELRRHLAGLSQQLEGRTVEILTDSDGFRDSETFHGRTGRGDRWSVWAPGLVPRAKPARPPRAVAHVARARRTLPQAAGGTDRDAALDFLDDAVRAREATVQEMVVAFDAALGRPVMGPSKLHAAWEAGLRSFDEVAHAPYERLEPIPGFGPAVAALVVRQFGGTVPPPRPRLVPRPPDASRPLAADVAAVAPLVARSAPGDGSARASGPTEPEPALLAASGGDTKSAAVGPASPPPPDLDPGAGRPTPGPPPSLGEPDRARPRATDPSAVAAAVPGPERPGTPSAPGAPPVPPSVASAAAPRQVVPLAAPGPLTVTPLSPPASVVGPTPGVELWPGGSTEAPWGAFLEATGAGHRGICVTREFPDRLRAFLGTRDVEVFWLSNVGRDRAIRPADLDGLQELLRRLLGERSVTAVYLDGIEYLLRIHGVERTRAFLLTLESELRVRDARAWIPVNPALVDPAAVAALEADLRVHAGSG